MHANPRGVAAMGERERSSLLVHQGLLGLLHWMDWTETHLWFLIQLAPAPKFGASHPILLISSGQSTMIRPMVVSLLGGQWGSTAARRLGSKAAQLHDSMAAQ